MDEVFVDVSKEAAARVAAGDAATYHGHVLTGKVCGCRHSQALKCQTHAFGGFSIPPHLHLLVQEVATITLSKLKKLRAEGLSGSQ